MRLRQAGEQVEQHRAARESEHLPGSIHSGSAPRFVHDLVRTVTRRGRAVVFALGVAHRCTTRPVTASALTTAIRI